MYYMNITTLKTRDDKRMSSSKANKLHEVK